MNKFKEKEREVLNRYNPVIRAFLRADVGHHDILFQSKDEIYILEKHYPQLFFKKRYPQKWNLQYWIMWKRKS